MIFVCKKLAETQDLCESELSSVEDLYSFRDQIHKNAVPLAKQKAGDFRIAKAARNLTDCLKECCRNTDCTSIWMYGKDCYLIACKTAKSCSPTYTSNRGNVLVNIRDPDCKPACQNGKVCISGECIYRTKSCEIGLTDECDKNEECQSSNNRKRNGVCLCKTGYTRDKRTNRCLKDSSYYEIEPTERNHTDEKKISLTISFHTTTTVPSQETTSSQKQAPISTVKPDITVSAGANQVIVLPKNEVTLSAYAFPNSDDYTYSWELVKKPTDTTGVMDGLDTSQLRITQLKEGSYTFKVKVSSSDGRYGEALVNVTVVKSEKDRKNEAENLKAIIRPPNLKVQQPNAVVLDGSASEGPIQSYEWSIVSGPLQHPSLVGTKQAILRLKSPDPGKYVFKLTIKSASGHTASAKANVTVLKEIDNPPKALIKESVVLVNLPNDTVTLHANSSSDDHGIVSYQWTKKSGKPVDVIGTDTAHLTVSHLTAGEYTFKVKVTDAAGQSDETDVSVIVADRKNAPPEANAGEDQVITLPSETVTLDASQSKDDEGIKSFKWTKIKGDDAVEIKNADRQVATAENLKEGAYEFQVEVQDQKGVTSTDTVKVTVKKAKNKKPVARLPDDMEVTLPISLLEIDGRKSSDDKDIAKWEWKKAESSLASVKILNNSDSSPILLLTDFMPGKYTFNLKVTDTEGLISSATVGVVVKPDPNENEVLEAIIDTTIESFTSAQFDQLEKRIALLLKAEATGAPKVVVREIRRPESGKGIKAIFVVKSASGKYLPGASTAETLRKAVLNGRAAVLDWQILALDTVICQNNCSNHGRCDPSTKQCICDAFWMHNLFKRVELGRKNADCDWSVLYVIVVATTSSLFIIASFWAVICICRRRKSLANAWKRRKRSPTKYSLLQDEEENVKMVPIKHDESEFSSDEDTLFVSHKMRKNKNSIQANGHTGNVRRVKT